MNTIKPITRKQSDARLYALARKLEEIDPERFNFGVWVGDDFQGKPDLSCGTTACALGWATTMKAARKSGLRMGIPGGDSYVTPFCTVSGQHSCSAATHPLGLTEDEAGFLFMWDVYDSTHKRQSPNKSATSVQVAAHIRQFVKDRRELAKGK